MTEPTGALTFGQALGLLGVTPRDGEDIVLATKRGNTMPHRVFTDVLASEIVGADSYIATGRFRRGTVAGSGGRSGENLASVWAVAIDSDLGDFLGSAPHKLDDAALHAAQDAHLGEAATLFDRAELLPRYTVRTGYGLSFWWPLPGEDQGRIADAQALQRDLVAGLNALAGRKFADPAAKDAGTRLMRLPGSLNLKNPDAPRRAALLHDEADVNWTLDTLRAAADALPQPAQSPVIAISSAVQASDALSPADEGEIIAAMQPHWRENQRHSLALGLAGWLKREGVPESQTLAMIEALAGDEDERGDRLRAVRDTYTKGVTAGYIALRGVLPGDAIQRIDDVLTARWKDAQPCPPRVVWQGATATPERHEERAWPMLPDAVRYGLLGEIVAALEPHTEADPAAVAVMLLVMFGNAAGRAPHTMVGGQRHGTNENVVIVGRTSRGRKGTAQSDAMRFLRVADKEWAEARLAGGISSGEGLMHAVRDEVWGLSKKGEPVLTDPGVKDKRLMVIEPEYAGVLKVARREGNTSTEAQRRAWDGGDLGTMTRKDPLRATKPHISIIGHITADELRRTLDDTSPVNGYLNRFVIVCAHRSKLLPHGGALPEQDIERLGRRLERAMQKARQRGAMQRTPAANAAWEVLYAELEAEQPGLFGAITGRASAHVLRFSLLYALLDEADAIDAPHVAAAAALWRYCEDSARYVFGDATGDPVADRVLSALRAAADGMAQNDLGPLFSNNLRAGELGRALEVLTSAGLAQAESRAPDAGKGRRATIWHAVKGHSAPASLRVVSGYADGINGRNGKSPAA